MKNVKNLFLTLMVATVAIFSSCDNEDVSPDLVDEASVAAEAASSIDTAAFSNSNVSAWTEIEEADLPQSVLDYIADNYGDDEIDHAWVDENGGYVVLLEGGTAVRFDNAGVFVEAIENARKGRGHRHDDLTEIDAADLPAAITDYIAENYPDEVIDKAGVDADGNYHVKLEDGPVLIFDADGNFLEERARGDRDGRDHDRDRRHADDRWTAIDIADLPAAITDYIAENYPDANILKAGTDDEGQYGVVLDTNVALIFDTDGVFIEEKAYHEHDGDCDEDDDSDDDDDSDGEDG